MTKKFYILLVSILFGLVLINTADIIEHIYNYRNANLLISMFSATPKLTQQDQDTITALKKRARNNSRHAAEHGIQVILLSALFFYLKLARKGCLDQNH